MANCPECNHYAYMRIDGSIRCVSCNYDDQKPICQSTFQPIKPEFQRHDTGLSADEYQKKIRGLI